jgi:hypothetical protein
VRAQHNDEAAMATLIKKTQSRIVRWFKEFSAKNRPQARWYEHDTVGMH